MGSVKEKEGDETALSCRYQLNEHCLRPLNLNKWNKWLEGPEQFKETKYGEFLGERNGQQKS